MRMLVVDDEPVSRRKLQLLLEQYGTCETADSGERALELICQAHAQTEPYALITMDIELPGIQGPEVVARIRQWERENAVGAPARIVMVTVMADVPTVMAALKTGCDRYLLKPFTPDKIRETLTALGYELNPPRQKAAGGA